MSEDNELLDLQESLYTSRNPTRRWLHCSRRDWILSQLPAGEGSVNRALEVGPGSGIYLPELCSAAYQVVASDIEDAFLHNATLLKAKYKQLNCRKDDITNTKLEKKSFDLILCTEVIEHIEDSRPVLVGLASLLTDDGVLILTTPQRLSVLELCAKIAFLPVVIQLVRLVYREPILETGHINLLTESKLHDQIDNAGLTIAEHYKCGMYLPIVAEFGGTTGLRLQQRLERFVRGSSLDSLLWTQCYVLEKRGA